jgi:hypothetical protein
MNIIKSLNKIVNDININNCKILRVSLAKNFNITYRVKYNNDTYIVRECENKEHYDFLKSVNIEMEKYNICPPSLLYDEENKIIVSKYVKTNKNITKANIEDVLNKITILQNINIQYNTILEHLQTDITWLDYEQYVYHKKWCNMYKTINRKLKEELGIFTCHSDLHLHNILFNNNEIYLIDFEYITKDHKFKDIATLMLFIDKNIIHEILNLNIKEKLLLDISYIEVLLYYSKLIKEICKEPQCFTINYNEIITINSYGDILKHNLLDPKENYLASVMSGKTAEQKIKELYSLYPDHIDYINSFFTFE